MREKMSLNDAKGTLGSLFFCSYYGPGVSWRHSIERICRKYPRGSGTSRISLQERATYEAAFRVKQEMSRSSGGRQ